MDQSSAGAYVEPAVHEAISRIIRRHSTNPTDVRHAAIEGVDMTAVTRLLDLGCGFGFMVDALAGSIPPGAEIVGIDMHSSNREAFLARAEAVAGSARFLCRDLDEHIDFAGESFDAVTASYSLYFFPRLIPEVARVLRPDGVFVSLTHSDSHFRGLLQAIGVPPQESAIHALLQGFSAENGAARLSQHFARVESRPYPNTLVFDAADLDDYLTLVRFKLPSLLPAPGAAAAPAGDLVERARDLLLEAGRVTIDKDDAAFICTGPRAP